MHVAWVVECGMTESHESREKPERRACVRRTMPKPKLIVQVAGPVSLNKADECLTCLKASEHNRRTRAVESTSQAWRGSGHLDERTREHRKTCNSHTERT
jgi:hypothetical protein